MSRVVLAMSGGVDSSVAAHLLHQQGHELIGVFLRHGEPASRCATSGPQETGPLPIVPSAEPLGHRQGCCTAADAADARRVADRLEIPFFALDLQEDFNRVIDYFVGEYAAARTPNPCVMCNNWIKFGRLFDYARSVGADYLATGHYARLAPADDGPALWAGVDQGKDQSYVLFGIERRWLPQMLLPLGAFHKPQIRRLAREFGLRVADKPDSQEICFVPDQDHAGFIRRRRGPSATAGQIVTSDGRVVGQHDGLERFTIGQRKGLGVALGEPWFVVRLDPAARQVVLGRRAELARSELTANQTNWLAPVDPGPMACQAKIRYNSPRATATLTPLAAGRLHLAFDEPQFGVAPGQAVVCYQGDRVLGGGWIE